MILNEGMDTKIIQVGVGLFVVREQSVLLGRRLGAHGHGEYAPAGGNLEYAETFKQAALRELKEEMGTDIKVANVRLLGLTAVRRYSPYHFIDIALVADWQSGTPQVTEPHKTESWDWFNMNKLPKPLYGRVAEYLQAYQAGNLKLDIN